jgi:hypothetical protein
MKLDFMIIDVIGMVEHTPTRAMSIVVIGEIKQFTSGIMEHRESLKNTTSI